MAETSSKNNHACVLMPVQLIVIYCHFCNQNINTWAVRALVVPCILCYSALAHTCGLATKNHPHKYRTHVNIWLINHHTTTARKTTFSTSPQEDRHQVGLDVCFHIGWLTRWWSLWPELRLQFMATTLDTLQQYIKCSRIIWRDFYSNGLSFMLSPATIYRFSINNRFTLHMSNFG